MINVVTDLVGLSEKAKRYFNDNEMYSADVELDYGMDFDDFIKATEYQLYLTFGERFDYMVDFDFMDSEAINELITDYNNGKDFDSE